MYGYTAPANRRKNLRASVNQTPNSISFLIRISVLPNSSAVFFQKLAHLELELPPIAQKPLMLRVF
jgi:hypothetical protein